ERRRRGGGKRVAAGAQPTGREEAHRYPGQGQGEGRVENRSWNVPVAVRRRSPAHHHLSKDEEGGSRWREERGREGGVEGEGVCLCSGNKKAGRDLEEHDHPAAKEVVNSSRQAQERLGSPQL
ncbi:unnamed protein product, partial [Discosporangium mesarthrocarpum]